MTTPDIVAQLDAMAVFDCAVENYDLICAASSEITRLRSALADAQRDQARWRWLANDCDGDDQDDFIQWLASNVATREMIESVADAGIKRADSRRTGETQT